jgi:multiple sugar transport system permease protein
MRSARLGEFYWNSLAVAGLTTVLGVAHNSLAGFAFAKLRFAGKRVLFGLTLATMMLPVQVCFIFAYIIAGRLGMVDNVRALVVPFLASGFGIYYMRQAIAGVPDSLLEAGRMDGMSDLETFWHLVRPTVWPAVAALAIFTFVASWNSFFWPLIVVDSDRAKTLPLAVAELASGRYVQSWPVRMATATIITGPLIVVFLIFQRAFVRGVALTGEKE